MKGRKMVEVHGQPQAFTCWLDKRAALRDKVLTFIQLLEGRIENLTLRIHNKS
jgi:hypothetical protein